MELDYQAIFRELNRRRIDYIVAGGLAVNFHGIPRMTYDIDLLVRLEPANIKGLISMLRDWDYRPRLPVEAGELADEAKRSMWISQKNMVAFTFINSEQAIEEIDVLIELPVPYDELKSRAVHMDVGGEPVDVMSVADLIAFKEKAGRKQDLSDVENLKKLPE